MKTNRRAIFVAVAKQNSTLKTGVIRPLGVVAGPDADPPMTYARCRIPTAAERW